MREEPLMPRVCLASSFPAKLNVNLGIVGQLANGFELLLGAENVFLVSFESILDQVTKIRPDLVILVGSTVPASCAYQPLAQAAKRVGCVFAFWTVEDPYEFDYTWRFTEFADVIFTNDRWALEFYERDKVYHLPTAASRALYHSLDGFDSRPLDIFFCGVGFGNRQRFILDALPALERYRSLVCGDNWPESPNPILTNRRLTSSALIEYYASTKFVLNLGRDYFIANEFRGLQATTPGPRTYEAAMVGCVQLYFQPSYVLEASFVPGEEIVTFNTVDELESRLAFLMDNPDKALAIARRAQDRCLRDHTYESRAQAILDAVGLPVGVAPANADTAVMGGGDAGVSPGVE